MPDSRPSAHKRGYTRNWQRLRLMVLNDEPLCRHCAANGRDVAAEHVDHDVALEAGGTNDPSNLVPLCASCHSRKTVERYGGLGRAKQPAREA
ncbi:HNH endonuclease [Frigoriglobus tundricola]|nr:HNH endonuclease signature motif containing protein [Frigoriglobus tundricola]